MLRSLSFRITGALSMSGEKRTSPVHQSAVIHTPKSKIGYFNLKSATLLPPVLHAWQAELECPDIWN
ncbi:MAG TPA: hypothetical protein V6C65_03655, partial [Allocoleopsis sp.]